MNIAVLGGSFDPPHIGHVLIAQQVLERLPIQEVWLMPLFAHSFQKSLSTPFHRLAMTKLLETKDIKVSKIEMQQKRVNLTIQTLRILQAHYPQHNFTWIIGSDQLQDFPKWEEWQAIIVNHGLIVFPREIVFGDLENYVTKTLHLKKIPKTISLLTQKDLVLTNISSTMVRKRVKEKKSIHYLVPEIIEQYIIKYKLYNTQ